MCSRHRVAGAKLGLAGREVLLTGLNEAIVTRVWGAQEQERGLWGHGGSNKLFLVPLREKLALFGVCEASPALMAHSLEGHLGSILCPGAWVVPWHPLCCPCSMVGAI